MNNAVRNRHAIAGAVVAPAVAVALLAGLSAGTASASNLPRVIQVCHGHVCTSVRPSSFRLDGDVIHRIHWITYTASRAHGHSPTYGGFGVRVVFFSPVTSHGRHYFKRVFFQTAKFGSCSQWTWHGDKYVASRYCPFS